MRAYLDPDLIVATAVKAGADAIYPGYGFLSENPKLAEACTNAGITFVGPTSEVLTLAGNKATAIAAARAAGVPTLASVEPTTDVDGLLKGMVEKGWLKANPAGTWYYLTVDGADRVKAA